MKKQKKIFVVKGISQDLSNARSNDEYAFSALNARVSLNRDTDLLSISNEKGTLNTYSTFKGTLIGYTSIKSYIILFTTEDSSYVCKDTGKVFSSTDRIYRVENKNNLHSTILYEGNLNFNKKNWIEAIGLVETENIYSVYWVDGINPLNKINVKQPEWQKSLGKDFEVLTCKDNYKISSKDNFTFNEKVTIEKKYNSSSLFNAGIVQYAFTYFNLNGRESSVFYWSPINYLTFNDRGGAGNERVTSSFKIKLDNLNTNYEYVRVYSIVRTSLDSTPIVSKVADRKISNSSIIVDDNNSNVTSVDSTLLLYLESNNIIANTLTYKDNTLFLGNYTFNTNKDILDITVNSINSIIDESKKGSIDDFWLDKNESQITYFKKGEKYLLGVIFRKADGTYSNVHFIKSFESLDSFSTKDSYISLSSIIANISISNKEYIQAIPLIKYNTISQRKFICQGIINPTVYRVRDRIENKPYSYSSWFIRPNVDYSPHVPYNNGDRKGILNDELPVGNPEFRNGFILPFSGSLNAEMPNQPMWGHLGLPRTHFNSSIKSHKDAFIVDRNTVSFYSSLSKDLLTNNLDSVDFNLIGVLPIESIKVSSNSILDGNTIITSDYTSPKGYNRDTSEFPLNKLIAHAGVRDIGENQHLFNKNHDGDKDAYSNVVNKKTLPELDYNYSTLYSIANSGTDFNFPDKSPLVSTYIHYPWHHSGFINGRSGSKIKEKKLVNYHKSSFPKLFDSSITVPSNKAVVTSENKAQAIEGNGLKFIRSYVDEIVTTPSYLGYNTYPLLAMRRGNSFWSGIEAWGDNDESEFLVGEEYNTSVFNKVEHLYRMTPALKWANQNYISVALSRNKYIDEKLLDSVENDNFSDTYLISDEGRYAGVIHYSLDLDNNIMYKDYPLYDYFNSSKEAMFYSVYPIPEKYPGPGSNGNSTPTMISYPIPLTYKCTNSIAIDLLDSYLPDYLYKYENKISSNNKYKILALFDYYKKGNLLELYLNILHKRESRVEAIKHIFNLNDIDINNTPSEEYLSTLFEQEVSKLGVTISTSKTDNISNIEDFIINNRIHIPNIHGAYFEGELDNVINKKKTPINIESSGDIPKTPYLFIGELVNKEVEDIEFNDLESSVWSIAGDPVKISNNTISLKYTNGDFYIGKSIKVITEPLKEGMLNNVVDIIEYIEETPINIHGNYSRQTKIEDLDNVNPTKLISINDVYSQKNNYKQYNYLPNLLFNSDSYPSNVLWSKEKHFGAITDNWLNIGINSSYQLDGDKGNLNYLETFRDSIIGFQDNGICNIIFNPRVQIPVSDGIPVEIGNSMKVEGKRYISDKIGCQNKWSIVKTYSSLYFIDSNGNTLYSLGEGLSNISDKFGFRKFFEDRYYRDPKNINPYNFLSLYDDVNNRVYFSNNEYSLCFNELTNSFESFFSYKNIRALFSIENSIFSINTDNNYIWEHNKGDYGNYYDRYYRWGIEYRVRGESVFNKTFTNVEFRADSFNNNEVLKTIDFDKLYAKTEYQNNSVDLVYNEYKKSTLKKQNRVWYMDIPRASNSYKSNRISNPWVTLRLEGKNKNKTILHDFVVSYYE